MMKRIMIGGFGGQGVMLAGQILCYSAMEMQKKGVTFFPSYGAEQRGGTANCFVVIGDSDVGAPIPQVVDDFIAFNDAALKKLEGRVCREGTGTIFVNSSVVREAPRKDVKTVRINATELAIEIGSARTQNLIMLGAYIGYTGLISLESAKKTVEIKLGKKRPQMIPLNCAALEKGYQLGRAALEEGEA